MPSKHMTSFAPNKNYYALLLGLCGFLLIFCSLSEVGISADSITYTSVSRNLNAHGNLHAFDGEPMVDFPLGYPLLLGAIQFMTRLDPFRFGLFLSSFLFGTLIYMLISLLKQEGFPPVERYLVGLCLVLSPALVEVYQMLWSETVFIFCIVLFLAAATQYGRTKRTGWVWAMALICAWACFTRYAALTLVVTGCLAILGDRSLPFKTRWWRSVWFGGVSMSLLVFNLLRNWRISGTTTGDRKKNFLPLSIHLHRFGDVLSGWVPPLNKYPALFTPLTIVFLILIIGAGAYFWIKRKETLTLFALCKTFCVIYALFILAISVLTEFEGLDVRLLSPLYIPALLGLMGAAYHLFYPDPDKKASHPAPYILSLGLIGLMAANGVSTIDYIKHPEIAYNRYVRYDIETLRHSPTLHFIDKHPALFQQGVSVYSNAPDLMYLLSSRKNADYIPDIHEVTDVRQFIQDSSAYLVWLNACRAYPRSDIDSLRKSTDLTQVYTFSDGAIYYHE
jgi:hypothetical protein